jgi:hypothetical protein
MSPYEQIQIDLELRSFTAKNFEKPSECRDATQVEFYRSELCSKIDEYKTRFNYVPVWAYALLEQYNTWAHASLITSKNFTSH